MAISENNVLRTLSNAIAGRAASITLWIFSFRRKVDLFERSEKITRAIFDDKMHGLKCLASPNAALSPRFEGQLAQRDGLLQFANALRRQTLPHGLRSITVKPLEADTDRCFKTEIIVQRKGAASEDPPVRASYQWDFHYSCTGRLIRLQLSDRATSTEYPLRLTEKDYYQSCWDHCCNATVELGRILRKLRALILTIGLLAVLLIAPPQTREALRVGFEELVTHEHLRDVPVSWGFLASAATFIAAAYFYGFAALTTRRKNDRDPIIGAQLWNLRLSVLVAILVSFWLVIAVAALSAKLPALDEPSTVDVALNVFAITAALFGLVLAAMLFGFTRVIVFKRIRLRRFVSHRGTVLLMIVVTLLALLNLALWWSSSSAPIVAIVWSTLALMVLGWLVFASTRMRIPFVLLVIAFPLLLGAFNLDNHMDVRHETSYAAARDAKSALVDWVTARRSPQQSITQPVFIVAAEGGGLRAAVVTATVLDELRARYPQFANCLFAIIGVSGGSVGAATFAAAVHDKFPAHRTVGIADFEPTAVQKALHADLLTPAIRAFLSTTIFIQYVPTRYLNLSKWDRSRALEDALSDSWQTANGTDTLRGQLFNQLSGTEGQPAPNLILMTTSVADGEPMAISHLRNFGVRTLADIQPVIDVPLATAAMMSARFPFISSTAHVPDAIGAADFVDGGYFENSGLTATVRLIRALRKGAPSSRHFVGPKIIGTGNMPDPRLRKTSVVVIKIRNGSTEEAAASHSAFFGLSSQLTTVYTTGAARAADASRALDELVESSPTECNGRTGCLTVAQITFSLTPKAIPIPLGWLLSDKAHSEIVQQLGSVCNEWAFAQVGGALARGMPGPRLPNCAK